MLTWLYRDRLFNRIYMCKIHSYLSDPGQAFFDLFGTQVREVKVHVTTFKSHAFIYLSLDRARYNVPWCKVKQMWRITFHEAFPIFIFKDASLSTSPLR